VLSITCVVWNTRATLKPMIKWESKKAKATSSGDFPNNTTGKISM
jgi:hypothetical protein